MTIKLGDENIRLNPYEVQLCRKQIAQYIQTVRKASSNRISYYFTFLIMMHVMSENLLDQMDPKELQQIMDTFQRYDEEHPQKP